MRMRALPPTTYFAGSAVFHYLGPAFAVLLFARVEPLGVAWLRIASAAAIFALWRRPWRGFRSLDRGGRRLVLAMGCGLALMNVCFYLSIARLPLGTVAAIEFLPVIAIAAAGTRTPRNAFALLLAVGGVYLLTQVRLEHEPLGLAFAFANAALFALYIVLGHRVAQRSTLGGIDGLAAAMLVAVLVATPIGAWQAAPAVLDPVALGAGLGVGISSSVIPYVCDQLAMSRLSRSTYALLVSLLPATATAIGVVVLAQLPTLSEAAGVAIVVLGVALRRDEGLSEVETAASGTATSRAWHRTWPFRTWPLSRNRQRALRARAYVQRLFRSGHVRSSHVPCLAPDVGRRAPAQGRGTAVTTFEATMPPLDERATATTWTCSFLRKRAGSRKPRNGGESSTSMRRQAPPPRRTANVTLAGSRVGSDALRAKRVESESGAAVSLGGPSFR
jgi:inner membrane transporter RhtA